MIYITPVWKGWLLELFYGFRFRPIFSSKWPLNSSEYDPVTIWIFIYAFISLIRYRTAKIIPFYDFFVTFQNLDFWALFWPYWKRAEPDIVFDDAKTSSLMLSKKNKLILSCWYRATCPHLRKYSFFGKSTKFKPLLQKRGEFLDDLMALELFSGIYFS